MNRPTRQFAHILTMNSNQEHGDSIFRGFVKIIHQDIKWFFTRIYNEPEVIRDCDRVFELYYNLN